MQARVDLVEDVTATSRSSDSRRNLRMSAKGRACVKTHSHVGDAQKAAGLTSERATKVRTAALQDSFHACCCYGTTLSHTLGRMLPRWPFGPNVRSSMPPARKPPFRFREEFRTPIGVRKSPKNEPAGSRVQAYGDLRIWLRRGEWLWRFADRPASACRTLCTAKGVQVRGNRCAKEAMTPWIGRLNGAGEPMRAQGVDVRCHMVTTQRICEPSRVTMSPSRLVREKPAARAVGSSVGRTR